ncbi:MAG: AAA family ATPase [Candidatus Aminicenantes bacterium]|nr:AAA family ATPase [Candidatus Aminicenantes bacterium]
MGNMVKDRLIHLPPQNLEAEESLLCALLLCNDEVSAVREVLEPEDFYSTAHREIFTAMLKLADEEKPIDLVTLTNCLKERNQLEKIGGAVYLARLIDTVPIAVNVLHYADIIKEKAGKRLFIDKANKLSKKAYDDTIELDILLTEDREMSLTIAKKMAKESEVQKIDISFEAIQSYFSTIVETPFNSINNVISGLAAGELVVIGGRPGIGKTAFALHFLRHTAIECDRPVIYFGAMMDEKKIHARLLAQQSRMSLRKEIMGGRQLEESQVKLLLQCQEQIRPAPIYDYIVNREISVSELQSNVLSIRDQIKQDIGLIIIENLQQIDWPARKFKNPWERADFVYPMLREFCSDIKTQTMVSSQLKKEVENREDKRPKLSDLFGGESAALSDTIFLLHRPDYYKKEEGGKREKCENAENNAEITIGKGAQPIILPFTFLGEPLLWEEIQ